MYSDYNSTVPRKGHIDQIITWVSTLQSLTKLYGSIRLILVGVMDGGLSRIYFLPIYLNMKNIAMFCQNAAQNVSFGQIKRRIV